MILQALKEYADRKGDKLGSFGYEMRAIPFLIALSPVGEFVDFIDMRERQGKTLKVKLMEVPQSQVRSGKDSWKTAFTLWDHYGYVLGYSPDGNTETANKQYNAFLTKTRLIHMRYPSDVGVSAVLAFLEKGDFRKLFAHVTWPECAKIKGCNLTYKIAGEANLVCQSNAVRQFVEEETKAVDKDGSITGTCLITGDTTNLMRLHPTVGLYGLKKPSPLCSSNDDESPAFSSFRKSQGFNFPVGKLAALDYSKALNSLIKSSTQRMSINETTMVFWSAKDSSLESQFIDFFNESPQDDPDRQTRAVRALFTSIESGSYAKSAEAIRFYVLGLSPNAARISVRLWIVSTVADMSKNIQHHFDDTRIVHGPKDKDTLSLFRLLVCTAVQGKADNIPPNLSGDTMRAILEGLPYPQTLLQTAIRRIRAEQEITYPRAALIKACINRSTRYTNPEIKEELKMSLDEANSNIGYRLGRLFAALEKIQLEANPGINATIRDRSYGAASSSPVTVFGNLMRLKNHHLAKFDSPGRRIYFEKLLCQIMDGVNDFPPHLILADQGRFAIGYYHQMQDFYTKKSEKTEAKGEIS